MSNDSHTTSSGRPRIGVPWRTAREEKEQKRHRYDDYLRAVREAGGEPAEISLLLPSEELQQTLDTLDGFVLPGSPADVDPARYGEPRHARSADPDPQREATDFAVLEHALAAKKPVLAICYGVQLLNVYLGGSLIQDIPSELRTHIRHDRPSGTTDSRHPASIEAGSRLAELASRLEVEVNSSHHQAIREPGRGLRVSAHSPDGVIEAVEPTTPGEWLLGVQWHPERMVGDALAGALFRELVAAARSTTVKG